MYNAKIEFKNIDSKIFVRVKALCNSKFNDKKIETLSLEIDTEVNFRSIQIGPHKSEKDARDRLNPYIDSNNFKYSVSKLELSNNSIVEMGQFDFKK